MQTRLMERSNNKEKRVLDPGSSEEVLPQPKRPALASVIVEALKVDSLHKLCSSLEPILRRVVSEEVERALAKLGSANLQARASPKRIDNSNGKNLRLHFQTRLAFPFFTGGKLEGEQGAAIHIILIDTNTGRVVTTGPESSIKVDVVVLAGDFNDEDEKGWSQDEFESYIVKEREGKRPLLNGELQVILKEGVGTLGDLSFTDNSSWIRSRKFRLGLKVASGCCEGIRIREAKTDAFTVKDHRGELYKKHYPPALSDEVWRLEKIGKDGSFHKKLNKAGIFTVEDFLRLVVRDSQRLRNVLGSGMSNKMWDVLVEHSKTCILSGKLYIYYSDDARNVGVVFNGIYELGGLIAGGQYHPADSLSESQKVYVDTLVNKAYENWMHVIEYDGNSLSSFHQEKNSSASQSNVTVTPQNNSNLYDAQLTLPTLPATLSLKQATMNTIGGQNLEMATRCSIQSQNTNLNAPIKFDETSFPPHNQIIGVTQPPQPSRFENFIGVAPTQPSISSFGNYRGVDDLFTEEDIRTRSHQMLENEDMQHLLRMFNMGGQNQSDCYTYPSTPFIQNNSSNYGFDDDRTRSSGKAVVGWLKLKAALKWGIFIRKKAAERRAQLVELDDW